MDNKLWFKEAEYGMMAHWGLYSLLGGEYKGRRVFCRMDTELYAHTKQRI